MLFRGVTDIAHELIPSIGRGTREGTCGDSTTLESNMLSEFKRLTVPILKQPPSSEFEWLFLAQHYGLPTRLLDWSSNPLVALFFATEREDDRDGVVYYLRHPVSDQYHLFDYRVACYTSEAAKAPSGRIAIQPEQGSVIFVRPRYTDERYVNQRSVFSCPKDPFTPPAFKGLKRLSVKAVWKEEIRRRLRVLGISNSYMYPGIAGVASELRSLMFNPVASGRLQMLTLRAEIQLT
ncbi:FRG domain-containing protein [Pseudoxanthomonas sp. 3HH-4]|nr:FRG domain-containing protein [Pseudoxanthomonas sp. 3HH-4]